jgi:hypothetical protein
MIRHRRPQREIAFSFDSFLDLVANVVGIIIRLILIVWVGARSYTATLNTVESDSGIPSTAKSAPEDPLESELARSRRELEEAQAQLTAQLRQLRQSQEETALFAGELQQVAQGEDSLSSQMAELERKAGDHRDAPRIAALSLEELRERSAKVLQALHELQAQPSAKKALRFRTPVSQPVHSDEIMFECGNGRVTFIDLSAMLDEMKNGLDGKTQTLRRQWQVRAIAGPVGPFQMTYLLERERGPFEGMLAGTGPDPNASFRYGLSSWQVEPIALTRGESLDQAMKPGSEFRQVVDHLDARETTVTFWVYPDSFEVFRQLRDYLYRRDMIVAGRPLPQGIPISSSRQGTVSRGQ